MARIKIKLNRNLRRSILRGHPWVYKEAITVPTGITQAQLCQVSDSKGELCWALYDPHGPLSLRVLSTEKMPPYDRLFENRFKQALHLRRSVKSDQTNAFRLFNGEGDLLPGLICDVYDSVAVLQFDGQGPGEFWDKQLISKWLLSNGVCKSVIEKTRRNTEKTIEHLGGEKFENEIIIKENGAQFKVNLEKGQKTGFFLDQRDNRNYIRSVSNNKSVLNLFSYSGGFSIYAGLGSASKVTSVDVSKGAISLSQENWELNKLKASIYQGLIVDVFEYLKGEKELWDHIIVDPPSMSHSENQKDLAKAKYIEVFSLAAGRVKSQGMLSLSSCSSHITFNDFFEIIDETLSLARRRGQILRVSGQGIDHPFPHACHEFRYLKFVNLILD
ncbi:MAG: class I SAM-dependent rRNA methyltransferase [Oligoflexia bacterium]|nr:class I SAM-dependent rRNA methyltransferase [Oligoflexia bacterium]